MSRSTVGVADTVQRPLLGVVLIVVVLMLVGQVAGCAGGRASLEPWTRETLATGYASLEIAANTAQRLHAAKRITDEQRAQVRAELQFTLQQLDLARAAVQGRAPGTAADHSVLQALHDVQRIVDRLQAMERAP